MELLFATSNQNKLYEIRNKVKDKIRLLSLSDIGFTEEIPEPFDSIEDNAVHKASYIYDKVKMNCFAEDTGLCVNSLNGAPGVKSARYAGPERSDENNINLLLENLKDKTDRSAYFLTVIALIIEGNLTIFKGSAKGLIAAERKGNSGFGYDPVFFYPPENKTFAEMNIEEKNKISHRAVASHKLIDHLNKI